MQTLLPQGWAPPVGYANGIAVAPGRIVFIAGQVGWDAEQRFHSDDIAPQFEQALANVLAVLAEAGLHLHDYGKTPRPGRKMGHVTQVSPLSPGRRRS